MVADKNLFMYDFAIAAIIKDEGRYIKEWIDYHLLAGADHFILYNNGSTDNTKEILQPYIESGKVTLIDFPGSMMQIPAYAGALRDWKFFCRYIAFIDADEFIFPKDNKTVPEVLDEILSGKNNAVGLSVNWHMFGSGGAEKADWSRGVLERFLYRAPNDFTDSEKDAELYFGNAHVKTIVNPRFVEYYVNPHLAKCFMNCSTVNESGEPVKRYFNYPITDKKIILNHYVTKSWEEYQLKHKRGRADVPTGFPAYSREDFENGDRNEVFDDEILKYRAARKEKVSAGGGATENSSERLLKALGDNLLPMLSKDLPKDFFVGKMETFLTCRAVASYFQKELSDESAGKFFEELSLKAVLKVLTSSPVNISDAEMFLSELPKILILPYPIIENILKVSEKILINLADVYKKSVRMDVYDRLTRLKDLLQAFSVFKKNQAVLTE